MDVLQACIVVRVRYMGHRDRIRLEQLMDVLQDCIVVSYMRHRDGLWLAVHEDGGAVLFALHFSADRLRLGLD